MYIFNPTLQLIVSGLIVIWHGAIANIPAGWIICDGNNGTPNLLTRFVEGVATAATNPGATGGSTPKTTSGHQHDTPIRITVNKICTDGTNSFGAGAAMDQTVSMNTAGDPLATNFALTSSKTDSIVDARPQFFDVAFLMKT